MGRPHHTTVLIADDHPVLRAGLRVLLEEQRDVRVVGEATNGPTAEREVDQHHPDVAVVDLAMAGGGIDLILSLRARAPATRVVVLTMHDDAELAAQAFRAGASAYVVKSAECSELLRALEAVAAGERYVDPALAPYLTGEPPPASARGSGLSERERQVLTLVARGYTNKEIAKTLAVGMKTVETYRARAMNKASLKTRSDIVRYVVTARWIDALD